MNKKEFIETLIDMGGCGAKPKSWARGWDDAISEVLGIAEELDEPFSTIDKIAFILNDYHHTGVLSEECAIELIEKELYTYYGTKPPEFIIPIPNLKTSEGKQQYLTYDVEKQTYFASRLNGKLKQTFTNKELTNVPDMYSMHARLID